jgi:formate dehydrogenase
VAKVLCVLYDDPVEGYPRSYARDAIPRIERYYDGQTTPTPGRIDFEPGELLGSVSGELGLRRFLEERGHEFVVTSDKDRPDSIFERELPDAEIVTSQPFWPAYLTDGRIAKSPELKLAVTAAISFTKVVAKTYCISSQPIRATASMLRGKRGTVGSSAWRGRPSP